jgi:hypothetical protein
MSHQAHPSNKTIQRSPQAAFARALRWTRAVFHFPRKACHAPPAGEPCFSIETGQQFFATLRANAEGRIDTDKAAKAVNEYLNRRNQPSPIAWWALALAAAIVLLLTSGCITVDKSVHVFATIDASGMSRAGVHTTTENISDTKADGNSASAEADIKLPLLP